jgi:HEAT repeat protein
MQPVWNLLAFAADDLAPQPERPAVRREQGRGTEDIDELMRVLADPDGHWAARLRRLREADPGVVDDERRSTFVAFLVGHPDPTVREAGCGLLARWNQHDALIRLVGDRRFGVIKTATWALGNTARSREAAQCARQHLDDPRVTSTHACETLDTFVAHAVPDEALPVLERLVAEDEREGVRCHAVYALVKLGASSAITRLLPLLEAPPLVTWAVHLLRACRKLGLSPRGLDRLRAVDNLDVQREVGWFDTSRAHAPR